MSFPKIIDVRAVKGDSAFLIDDGKTSILYDTGFAFTGYAVAGNVRRELGARPLDYIFLTHSHYDHAAGSPYVKKYYPEAKIVAGEYAAKIFAKPTAKALMRELDRKFADTCGIGEYDDLFDSLTVDIPVADGDIIRAGDMEFKVLNLPGHTRCSVGYYCESLKLLLACETIGVFNGCDDVVPSYLVGYWMTLESIKIAMDLDINAILVPHYGCITGDTAKFYLTRGRERAEEIAKAISSMLNENKPKSEILEFFKDTFYRGYIREIYPVDAMELNTGIMINLIEKELKTS